MVNGHRIERRIEVNEFIDLMKNYSEDKVNCTHHTFFRLSQKQRKIFKCETIKDYLFGGTPVLVGVQYNKCYSAFYEYKNKRFIRIILDIALNKVEVVTFYIIENNQIPKIK